MEKVASEMSLKGGSEGETILFFLFSKRRGSRHSQPNSPCGTIKKKALAAKYACNQSTMPRAGAQVRA